ncbi:hypothetical protein FHG64_02980 [Antarcticibacterium flavum]|uniref:Uncharacterized protein n=1 Tax=Antarcticibacterium flavum TaxID=2058175 RepID=A0A5B7WYY5_9FLAO|nr:MULTISPECIES: hypothetical protein [Antarcticibacterium]MCM4161249.1 hypothetical protein [Antarcticibacterium sp. W02-3]QCY68434.1 hypothetical protein FHG64_02980 [Antarcticibacterium flavum]
MDRKTFIRKTSAGIIVGIPMMSMLGCSSSDDGGGPNPGPNPNPNPNPNPQANCVENGTQSSISANHGHNLTVSKEDVEAAEEKTYTLSQASTDNHIHEITISADQFNTLKGNNSISVTSTNQAGHTHSVSVSCA